MIQKKINEVELADIQTLVTLSVTESKVIEYKKELKIGTDSEKKEFLYDISSFANTSGGDLIFGIEESAGMPVSLVPLLIPDLDAQILQLENIIRMGVAPRISFVIHTIPTDTTNEYILIIRINESWNKPHRVIFSGANKFYARHSNGKYELDVNELRQAFTLSDGIEKRIKDFREERIFSLESGQVFLPLRSNNLIVLHLIPLESFSTKINLERDLLLSLEKETELFRPMYTNQWHSPRINLDGMFCFAGTENETAHSYIQLFRNGSLEFVETSILERDDHKYIPYVLYEKEVINGFKRGLNILKKIGMNTPIFLSLSLINVDGLTMAENRTSGRIRIEDPHPIKQKSLILPAITLNEDNEPVEKLLQPIFDLVWNACGLPKSENYDNDGNFLIIN